MLALALQQAVASSTAAPPSPVVINERLDYYRVAGRDGAELRSALSRSGPIGADGKHYDGYTKSGLSWSYDERRVGNRRLQARGKHILQDHSPQDADYDLRTQHGQTLGAVFP